MNLVKSIGIASPQQKPKAAAKVLFTPAGQSALSSKTQPDSNIQEVCLFIYLFDFFIIKLLIYLLFVVVLFVVNLPLLSSQ